jgi:hypothetical protein
MVRTLAPAILLAGFLVLTVGCGKGDPNRAAVSGAVSLDGTPLDEGSILFVPISGAQGAVTGGPIKDGRYQISRNVGATVGWNRVEIRSVRNTGKKIQYAPGTSPSVEVIQRVASQYNTNSTLKIEVHPSDNAADFHVSSK